MKPPVKPWKKRQYAIRLLDVTHPLDKERDWLLDVYRKNKFSVNCSFSDDVKNEYYQQQFSIGKGNAKVDFVLYIMPYWRSNYWDFFQGEDEIRRRYKKGDETQRLVRIKVHYGMDRRLGKEGECIVLRHQLKDDILKCVYKACHLTAAEADTLFAEQEKLLKDEGFKRVRDIPSNF